METYQYNTFKFFRRYFNLPTKIPLAWCIIQESSIQGTELRLGIILLGTRLYIDVAQRRFFTQIDCPHMQRICFPCKRISKGKQYLYLASEGLKLSKSKHYIHDIYSTSWFHKNLLNTHLF